MTGRPIDSTDRSTQLDTVATPRSARPGSGYSSAFRLYVKVDMEGLSGVVSPDQLRPGSPEFADARAMLMHDLGAVLDGAFEGGCTEAVIYDMHGDGRNVDLGTLDRRAAVISGRPAPAGDFFYGLDDTFEAMFLVGFHAGAGTLTALLPHSDSVIQALNINGTMVGEVGLEAALAGRFGVPLALVSGDSACVAEARKLLGEEVEAVEVKKIISPTSAVCLSTARTGLLLRESAARAAHRAATLAPVVFQAPAKLEATFMRTEDADLLESLPSMARTGPTSVCASGPSVVAAYREFVTAGEACREADGPKDLTSSDILDRRLIDGVVVEREEDESD